MVFPLFFSLSSFVFLFLYLFLYLFLFFLRPPLRRPDPSPAGKTSAGRPTCFSVFFPLPTPFSFHSSGPHPSEPHFSRGPPFGEPFLVLVGQVATSSLPHGRDPLWPISALASIYFGLGQFGFSALWEAERFGGEGGREEKGLGEGRVWGWASPKKGEAPSRRRARPPRRRARLPRRRARPPRRRERHPRRRARPPRRRERPLPKKAETPLPQRAKGGAPEGQGPKGGAPEGRRRARPPKGLTTQGQ